MLIDALKPKFKGISRADSLVVDPHKGLFLPYGIGAVIVKNKQAVFHSHHYRANYMQDAMDDRLPINPADVSPELTKHFRGFRMWLPLQLHGLAPFQACLQEKILLLEYMRERLEALGLKLGPDPDLTVTYFWCETDGRYDREKTERLLQHVHRDGNVFLSSSIIADRFVIRVAILSFRTKLHHADKAIQSIASGLDGLNRYV